VRLWYPESLNERHTSTRMSRNTHTNSLQNEKKDLVGLATWLGGKGCDDDDDVHSTEDTTR
jgi:hypothetical protein